MPITRRLPLPGELPQLPLLSMHEQAPILPPKVHLPPHLTAVTQQDDMATMMIWEEHTIDQRAAPVTLQLQAMLVDQIPQIPLRPIDQKSNRNTWGRNSSLRNHHSISGMNLRDITVRHATRRPHRHSNTINYRPRSLVWNVLAGKIPFLGLMFM